MVHVSTYFTQYESGIIFSYLCVTVTHPMMSPVAPTSKPITPIIIPIMRGVELLPHSSSLVEESGKSPAQVN